jgi:hypothetical protein
VRYCNTACVLAAAGVSAAVVDPFSPRQGGSHDLIVRPFTPRTPVVTYMLWSEAEPLSRLAKAFLNEVRGASRILSHDGTKLNAVAAANGFARFARPCQAHSNEKIRGRLGTVCRRHQPAINTLITQMDFTDAVQLAAG